MKNIIIDSKKAFLITIIGSLFSFYSSFQINMMNSLNGAVTQTFHASASQIAVLSAFLFYATIIMTIPAGLILDRFKVKTVMLMTLALSIVGTIIFAYSTSLALAAIGRFLSGIMVCFGLIACLKLASMLLSAKHMALISALIVSIGMIGSIASHYPLYAILAHYGYKMALLSIIILGFVILGVIAIFVPESNTQIPKDSSMTNVFQSLIKVIKQAQNWICGLYITFLNLPFAVLGALFGSSYLKEHYHFHHMQSIKITSFLFLGGIIGAPVFGWIADFIHNRKLLMLFGSSFCLLLTLTMLYKTNLQIHDLYSLFGSIGFFSAAQVLGYPIVTEHNPEHLKATALSLVMILVIGLGYGIGIPIVGYLLDHFWTGTIIDGVRYYTAETYHKAFMIMPIAIVLSILLAFFINDEKPSISSCKNKNS